MLSLKSGTPIAIITSGKRQGVLLRIQPNFSGHNEEQALEDLVDDDELIEHLFEKVFHKERKQISAREQERLRSMIKQEIEDGIESSDTRFIDLLKRSKDYMKNNIGREIRLGFRETFEPLPDSEKSERMYTAGPSGSGKSTMMGMYVNNYLVMFPNNKFYLFSRLGEDEALDFLSPIRVLPEEVKDINLEDLSNSICVFDDIDTYPDKETLKAIYKLRQDCIECGRKLNITTLTMSHQLMNWGKTRDLLNESMKFILFPKASNKHCRDLMQRYCGFSKKTIDRAMNMSGRWILIHKDCPRYILSEKECFIPD